MGWKAGEGGIQGLGRKSGIELKKSTFKEKNKSAISTELRDIQEEKRKLSDQIQCEKDKAKRETLVTMYKCTQAKALDCMAREKAQEITEKLEKITSDGSQSSLWKEKRHMTRDPMLESLVIKNDEGERLYTPEAIKEQTAHYYENLYRKKQFAPHPYHQEVLSKMSMTVGTTSLITPSLN